MYELEEEIKEMEKKFTTLSKFVSIVDDKQRSIYKYLDHYAILAWCSYISHKIDIGRPNTNFDGRPFIELPSGKKIKITIQVEKYNG